MHLIVMGRSNTTVQLQNRNMVSQVEPIRYSRDTLSSIDSDFGGISRTAPGGRSVSLRKTRNSVYRHKVPWYGAILSLFCFLFSSFSSPSVLTLCPDVMLFHTLSFEISFETVVFAACQKLSPFSHTQIYLARADYPLLELSSVNLHS